MSIGALEMEETAAIVLDVEFKELQPKRDAEIVGRVLDEDGKPIGEAEVTAFYWSGLEAGGEPPMEAGDAGGRPIRRCDARSIEDRRLLGECSPPHRSGRRDPMRRLIPL